MSTKENNTKPRPVPANQPSSSLAINIILAVAIVVVFFSHSAIKEKVVRLSVGVEKLSAPMSSEPLQLNVPGKNPMCPGAVDDFESCQEKLQRCKDT